jgi:hypothetical protein
MGCWRHKKKKLVATCSKLNVDAPLPWEDCTLIIEKYKVFPLTRW